MNIFQRIENWFISFFQSKLTSDLVVAQPVKVNESPVLVTTPQIPISMTQPTNKIVQWANAIAKWEGDVTGVNPGNMKYTTLTKSWGATQGRLAQDGGYFALFPTFEMGFTALCNFLTLGCENELVAFHEARTFETFTNVYAGNPPTTYIQGIATAIGCSLDTDISTFI